MTPPDAAAGSDDIDRELLATVAPETVAWMRQARDACRVLELDERCEPAIRSLATELADEINVVFKACR